MATEGILQFSVASVVEDVLRQQGKRLSDIDFASRKAEEAAMRRYEAAGWLRKMVGVVGGKDLPAEPSEEGFRLGLRSGIILCNVLNKIQPGAVPKVVEAPCDSVVASDGAALSAFQYFENVRNFLVAVEEMGLPTFEFSDLEQGGKSSRILNCVLALKSYSDWKQGGGNGSWKLGGNSKTANSGKHFVRKNSEPLISSFSRNLSVERSLDSFSEQLSCSIDLGNDVSEMDNTLSLHVLVQELLSDKKHDEIPTIVENMLSRVMEEFEYRIEKQNEQMKRAIKDTDVCRRNKTPTKSASREMMDVTMKMEDEETMNMEDEETMKMEDEETAKMEDEETMKVEDKATAKIEEEECCNINEYDEESEQILKQHMLVEKQNGDIQKLKHSLHTTKEGIQLLQMSYQEEVNILGKHLHTLAHAASGYHRVLEENRKLYNQLQDLKGNIRVYCRVRPFLHGQPNRQSTVDHIYEGNITVITPSKYGKEGRKSFSFNKVFGPSASQEEVFSDTQPLIRSVLDGYNVCIFAYGQTGSGKTYTMSGPDELTPEGLGVNYRALGDLFHISEQRKDIISYEICVQMIEIYNEQVRDLLATDSSNKKLEIRKNSQKGINVPDANIVPVTSTSDVIHLMNLGHKNRAVSSTAMNDRSSRSHSCLMVHVEGKDLTSGTVIRGCMNLIDLAGSERVDKSEVVGGRLKEAQHINKSLAALGDVISSLAQKNSHVPYRNSKLTQLLQDSLGGQAKTLMFVHISPEPDAIGETLSTLKFAERVATVELGAARTHKDSADVKELKDQIASLKAALARKEEEPESLQHSRLNSPDGIRMKSGGCSPSPSWQNLRNSSDNQRQPMEDVGNIEVRNNSIMKLESQSSDLQDLLISPPWPPIGSPGLKEDEKEVGSGNWVDKIMVNKQDEAGGDENHLVRQEEENRQLPEMFYQKFLPDNSKIYPDQSLNKLSTNKKDGQDCATTDESDDHDAATSDSSEPDLLWQLNLPKVSNIPNGPVSKIKRPVLKQSKIPEPRSLIPAPGTRRLSGGGGTPLQKTGRQLGSVDGRRKAGGGK